MVMLDPESNDFITSPEQRFERDLQLMRNALWMMPLLDTKEMARTTGFSENRCYRLLRELMERKLVTRATMGRAAGKRFRYWLTEKGVRSVADETGCPVPWQVAEAGIGWLVRRLPMVEAIYALAPQLMSHAGMLIDQPVYMSTLPDGSDLSVIHFPPDLRMVEFCWIRSGEIHAVVTYENGSWFALVWVGSMVTEHMLKEKGELAVGQLDGTFEPAGWVVVGCDRLATRMAAEVWPAENVLAVSADGEVAREMRPAPFTRSVLGEPTKLVRLGRPQNVSNWWDAKSRQYRPAMAALNGSMQYETFRFIAEWYGPTPAQLERRFGPSSRAAVRALRQAGLVVKLDGGFYLDWLGERTVARMDRVSPARVTGRMNAYLHENGAYRENQQRHNRTLVDIVQKLSEMHISAYGGWRVRRTAPDGTQVVPDVAALLDLGSRRVTAFMELEFTARRPVQMEGKRAPYVAVQRLQRKPIAQLWLVADPETEAIYRRSRRSSEPMLTAVLEDFLQGSSGFMGDNWRVNEARVNIYEVVYMMEGDDHAFIWEDK